MTVSGHDVCPVSLISVVCVCLQKQQARSSVCRCPSLRATQTLRPSRVLKIVSVLLFHDGAEAAGPWATAWAGQRPRPRLLAPKCAFLPRARAVPRWQCAADRRGDSYKFRRCPHPRVAWLWLSCAHMAGHGSKGAKWKRKMEPKFSEICQNVSKLLKCCKIL